VSTGCQELFTKRVFEYVTDEGLKIEGRRLRTELRSWNVFAMGHRGVSAGHNIFQLIATAGGQIQKHAGALEWGQMMGKWNGSIQC
jgi:hypothetical protein